MRVPALLTAAGGWSIGPVSVALAAVVVAAVGVALLVGLRRERRRQRRAAAALSTSEQRYRRLAEGSPIGIFECDPAGNRTYANPQLLAITGEPPEAGESLLPPPWHVHHDDVERFSAEFRYASDLLRRFTSLLRIVRPDGEVRWADVSAEPVLDGGRLSHWVGTLTDVTEKLELQARLQRFSEVLEATPDLVAMVDTEGRFQYLNRAARRVLGVTSEVQLAELRGPDAYVASTRERFLAEAMPTAAREGVWVGEVTIRLPDGGQMPASQVLVAHRRADDTIDYYSSITRDLSEHKRLEEERLRVGLFDALTGLPNRVLLVDRLAHALARTGRTNGRLALLTLDLDQFKLVNDSYGHDTGNELLQRVTGRLVDVLPAGDTAARLGGDTFCVLAEDVSTEEEALDLAERFSATLAAPYDLHGERVFLTVSIGIALAEPGAGGACAETLLRDAETAMHRAKEKGRARHELFDEAARTFSVHRLRTASDLHRALQEREFRLVYQPEVDIATGHISGVEALVRWHHPERGLVPPAEFIPLAEQTGLIDGIGAWVLDEAAAQAARWREARADGKALPVWVNLSARQLESPGLVDLVASTLRRHGVSAAQLGLEITESALLEDADSTLAALAGLRALGVRLAVDDFGTGYSSLAYLKRLPIDAVKIDRSFVDGLGRDGDDTAIVAAITGMARALRLSTIAEGVETPAQLATLADLGCHLAQGYLFTTPQPAVLLERLLHSDRGLRCSAPGRPPCPGSTKR